MLSQMPSSIQNYLLRLLPPEELALIGQQLRSVDLPKGFLIVAAEGAIDHVYFPDSGIGSVVAVAGCNKAEAGLFGRDGFSPVQAAIGAQTSVHEIVMQVAGVGHCIEAAALEQAMTRSPPLAHILHSYVQALSAQVAFTALSNATHTVDERLARWLLMCHDRVDGDELWLTHEYIALMLAVRRSTVTTTLHVLEGNGFIRSERGRITVRNRSQLEEFAGDAFGKPEQEYRRLLGDPNPGRSNVLPLHA